MIPLVVLAALAGAWFVRFLLARRARARFCPPDECLTLALRLKPGGRGFGWRHGFARLSDDAIEWRAEHKVSEGADLRFDRGALVVREHRPVRRGEAMLSDLCELVTALYKGEEIQLGVLRTELDTFLAWAAG